jgi:hypothetical protein
LRTDRATLEKLSIVRTLPNAPDQFIRVLAAGITDCFAGKAGCGSQESRGRGTRQFAEDEFKAKLKDYFAYGVQEAGEADGARHEIAPGCPRAGSPAPIHI